MSAELVQRNRQRTVVLDLRFLRQLARHLLEQELGLRDYQLGIQFTTLDQMARLNWRFLAHEGPTDVITFDHAEPSSVPASAGPNRLKVEGHAVHGELFICPAFAQHQAKRFRTTWQEEVVRYLVHGVLHLRGFDDREPPARRRMKRAEGRLLRRLARQFALSKAGRAPRLHP
jgi:probable rRNA maturation factor